MCRQAELARLAIRRVGGQLGAGGLRGRSAAPSCSYARPAIGAGAADLIRHGNTSLPIAYLGPGRYLT